MGTHFHIRLTFANVTSVIALFVALGGSATAALVITGKNVKNGSLDSRDLKNNSVRSVDIKNGDLLAKDFKPGQLQAGARGLQGEQGVQGIQGPPALNGNDGAPGPSDVHAHGTGFAQLSNDSATPTTVASITVPPGSYLVGGKATGGANSTSDTSVGCFLEDAGGIAATKIWDTTDAIVAAGAIQGRGTLSLLSADTFTTEQKIQMDCYSSGGAAHYSNARVWAVKTGNLHATLPIPLD